MRILHVMIRMAERDGGPPQGLLVLAKAQAALGDDVTILPCSSSGGKAVIEQGGYGRLTVLNAPTRASLKFPNAAVKKALLGIIRNFDIVHIHASWRYHFIAAGKAARKRGVAFIISPEGNLGRIPRKIKWYLKAPYFAFIERGVFESASAIHCNTKKELRELKHLKLSPRHFVVPQPVDDSLVSTEPDLEAINQICPGLGSDDPVLLYVGRVAWIKRLPVFLEAFIKISDEFKRSHLVLTGPWEEPRIIDDIKAKVQAANLEARVHLPGMVREGVKVALLDRATVFVQPSRHESFGISTAEALLFGKACVVSSGVALSDDIDQTMAGLVFPGDVESLTDALRKMLLDDEFRGKCEVAAKQLSGNFRPDAVARRLKQEYNRCISN